MPHLKSGSKQFRIDIDLGLQMLVDEIGDVTITNDGATILKLLEVEHPAAKVNIFSFCVLSLSCS